MTATSAFITSLVTSFLVFLVLFVVYLFLSRKPGNFHVYYPIRALHGEGPFGSKRGRFQWAIDAFKATDEELVAVAGLDATVYVHLFTTGNGSSQNGSHFPTGLLIFFVLSSSSVEFFLTCIVARILRYFFRFWNVLRMVIFAGLVNPLLDELWHKILYLTIMQTATTSTWTVDLIREDL
jgi:hypothetical protein